MRKRFYILAALILLMAGCGTAPQESVSRPDTPVADATPVPTGTPAAYAFGVSFEAEATATPVPTPTPTPAPTPIPFVGTFAGDTGYGALLLVCYEDGRVALSYSGESREGTWKYKDGLVVVSVQGEKTEFSFLPGELDYESGGITLALKKEADA